MLYGSNRYDRRGKPLFPTEHSVKNHRKCSECTCTTTTTIASESIIIIIAEARRIIFVRLCSQFPKSQNIR